MSFDLAINPNTGDLVIASNNDALGRSGDELIAQRIRVRLRVRQGSWSLDPSQGLLGSTLYAAMRQPSEQADPEIIAAVEQALEPMTDINLVSVDVEFDPETYTTVIGAIRYQVLLDPARGTLGDVQEANVFIRA